MNDKPGILGKVTGQVGNFGKQLGKGIVEEAKKTKDATKQQVGFEQGENKAASELEKLGENEKKRIEGIKKDENKQFVMGLYAKTDNKNKVSDQQREVMVETAEANQGKTPEEIQEIARLRQALHSDYYQQLTRPRPQQEEERPAEKVEKEKKEEEMELQNKEEKKPKKVALPQTHSIEKARGAKG